MKPLQTTCRSATMLALGITLILSTAFVPHTARAAKDTVTSELEAIKKRLAAAEARLEKNAEQIKSQSKTEVAGYAEVHYNNLNNKNAGGTDQKEIDLHRAVLEVEHHFNNKVRAEIELEVEHAYVEDSGSSQGELEVEQAFVEFTYDNGAKLKLGQFILPVGLLNKKHKPTAFYGVERNNVEKNIIPTTWWEAGALYHYKFNKQWSLDTAITSGLKTSSASNYAVRNGRQKGSKANANDLAYLATVKWKLNQDVTVGASIQHQSDITQSTDSTAGSANLFTTNINWQLGAFELRALYASWDLDGSGPAAVGADEQSGYYIEPAYRINNEWGVFTRHSQWDNRANDASDSEYSQVDFGVNYWPMKNIVIKADYQNQKAPTGSNEFDGINLGVGFYF